MTVKGIIKSIDFGSNTCMVRIPTWEPVGNPETVIPAVFSVTPGTYNGYKENDVVWVAFENNLASHPVIIGKLYAGTNADKTEPRGVVNCQSLTVSNSAVLPASTKITQATSDVLDERNGLQVQTLEELITAVAENAASVSNLVILEENPNLGKVEYSYAFSASVESVVQPTDADWDELKDIAEAKGKSELVKDDLTADQFKTLSEAAQLWLTAGGEWLYGSGKADDPKNWLPQTGYISGEDWIDPNKNYATAYPLLNVFKRTRSIYYQQGLSKVVTTEELVRNSEMYYPTEYKVEYALAPKDEKDNEKPATIITEGGLTWNINWTTSPPFYTDYPEVGSIELTDAGKNVYWEKQTTTYSNGTVVESITKSTMLDVNFINALGITAKKIAVTDEDGDLVFVADGISNPREVKIANFTVENDKLYSNTHTTLDSNESGIYLGSDGLSIGTGFRVSSGGEPVVAGYTKSVEKKYCIVDFDIVPPPSPYSVPDWWNNWDSANWTTTPPNREDGKYIWEWTKTIQTNDAGTNDDTNIKVCITGAKGDPGIGIPGRSVLSVTTFYTLAASIPDKPTEKNPDPTVWSVSPPSFEEGKKYYESDRTIYDSEVDEKDFSWSDVIENSMLTVDFINSLGITAKNITVTDKSNNIVFKAAGSLDDTPSTVFLSGGVAKTNRLEYNVPEADGSTDPYEFETNVGEFSHLSLGMPELAHEDLSKVYKDIKNLIKYNYNEFKNIYSDESNFTAIDTETNLPSKTGTWDLHRHLVTKCAPYTCSVLKLQIKTSADELCYRFLVTGDSNNIIIGTHYKADTITPFYPPENLGANVTDEAKKNWQTEFMTWWEAQDRMHRVDIEQVTITDPATWGVTTLGDDLSADVKGLIDSWALIVCVNLGDLSTLDDNAKSFIEGNKLSSGINTGDPDTDEFHILLPPSVLLETGHYRGKSGNGFVESDSGATFITGDGKLYTNQANISGTITAKLGNIGGFTITTDSLSNRSIDSTTGITLSTAGGSTPVIKAGDSFEVSPKGEITASAGTIGGWYITTDGLQNTVPGTAWNTGLGTIISDGTDSRTTIESGTIMNISPVLNGTYNIYNKSEFRAGNLNFFRFYKGTGVEANFGWWDAVAGEDSSGKYIAPFMIVSPHMVIGSNSNSNGPESYNSQGELRGTWRGTAGLSIDSDANLKHEIESLPDKYTSLFDNLKPIRFKYNNGTSDRYHVGFIAQDVEQAITNSGLTTQDVAGYIKEADTVDGNGIVIKEGARSIRYGEFVALNTDQIQKLKARVTELEATVAELTKLINEKLN